MSWLEDAKQKAREQEKALLESMDRVIGWESSLTPEDMQKFGERLDAEISKEGK